jgi:hypothetical protein
MEATLYQLSPLNLLLVIAVAFLILGIGCCIAGIIVLMYRVAGRHLQTLATQTTKLAQKGMAEEVAGLVGNASTLLDALNQLLKTTAGVGVFLCLLGMIFVGAAGWLAVQLYPVWP